MRRVALTVLGALLVFCATSASASASNVYRGINLDAMDRNKRSSTVLHPDKKGEYEVTWEAALFILAKDGTLLRADGFVPKPKTSNETFPVVIFPNSWGVPQIEYITRAHNLAKRGYLTLEYETRGWYSSGGEINLAGPFDRSDGSQIIDYMASQTQWNPDMGNLAFAGISYGAGISLMMAGYDTRVKTAVVMSGWNNISYLLYGNEVPNKQALSELYSSAVAEGKPEANLSTMLNDVLLHQNMDTIVKFAALRSPEGLFLDQYNSRQVPLFLSSNYLDQLFRPQYMLNDFFPKLTGPKHLLLNWGRHAIPEAVGLFDHHSKIWTEAYAWLDHYLKGEATGLESWPLIEAQHGGNLADPYVNLSDATAATTALYLGARVNGQGFGTMGGSAGSGVEAPITFTTDVGIKPPSATGQSLGELETTNLVKQNPATTVLYESEPFTTPVTVCGTPTVDLEFTATGPNWQFYPYLFSASGDASSAVYMSFGFKNHYASGPTSGPVAEQVGPNRWVLKGLQMHTICLTVPAGDRVAFGLVLYSPIYTPANDESSLGLSVVYGNNTKVNLPTPVFP